MPTDGSPMSLKEQIEMLLEVMMPFLHPLYLAVLVF